MKTAEIREQFLKFFEEKHNSLRVKSSSLIPDNPTILLTTAGMVQFIPYFLGEEKFYHNPERAVSCQKCARAGGKDSDIENVGRTPRHHTFFEMLGNFSFGDYFKEEIIPWAWEFVTNYLKLDKDRLWITIYENDDEAGEIWQKAGVPKERILKKGKKDNFWGPVGISGSCGPCSEIHYDLGEHLKCSDNCSIDTCECDRWVEIWNLVFTELFMDEKGNFVPLERKNVDTGMGLERIAMVCQNVTSTFETDLLKPILEKVSEISKKEYGKDDKTDTSLRIITDHARCVSFMIADKIMPSNEGRGYVLRMILRRALRHGFMLGLEMPFMAPIVDKVIENYGDFYPELKESRDKIQSVIKKEEERFKLTIERGFKHIDEIISSLKTQGVKEISGEEAFKLYDTYGFPYELTKEIAQESGIKVDETGFKSCMKEQKERARASVQKITISDDKVYADKAPTKFVGYENYAADAKVIAIIKDGEDVEESLEDDVADVILDTTPFYAESGGQIGDSGYLITENGDKIDVLNTFKVKNVYVHRIKGALSKGENIKAVIDIEKRKETTCHHSLAHLLQAALIEILGNEVHQAGSQVENNRTRYDFSFQRAMTKEEIEQTENLINKWIKEGLTGICDVMKLDDAKKLGATALFGEKYGETVRVVSFKNAEKCISMELCGGCHVKDTKDLRLAKIVSESAIAAGVRRIEIICSDSAVEYLSKKALLLDSLAQKYKIMPAGIEEKIEKLNDEIKSQGAKIAELEEKIANTKFESMLSRAQDLNGGKLFISMVEDLTPAAVRFGAEILARKLGECIIVLCAKKPDNTALILVKATDSFVKKGANAGKIVNTIASACSGGGGGKPGMAQGSAKDITCINDVLVKIENDIKAEFE